MYSAQLKRENNHDSQISVYYHPCNQNTNNHFGTLKQEEIRKLTFVIVSKLFLANRPIPLFVLSPLREFSFICRCKVCSAAGGHFKKLEIELNDRMKLENIKATPSWKFSTQKGLAHVATLSTRWRNTKQIKKQKQTGLSATYCSPISSSIASFS